MELIRSINEKLGILFGMFMTMKNPVSRAVSRVYLEFIRIMPQILTTLLLKAAN